MRAAGTVMSSMRLPLLISLAAVSNTLLGAGRICGDSPPKRARLSHTVTSSNGAAQERKSKPRPHLLRPLETSAL